MRISDSLVEFAPALALAQKEMGNVKAKSDNPMFRSKYVPLNDLLHFAKPILNKHGISIIQSTFSVDGHVGARTMLLHTSGEFIETDGASAKVELSTNREGRPTNSYGQAAGSLITYFRRYDGLAVLGMAETDNDAQVERNDAPVDAYDAETVRLFAKKIQEAMISDDFTLIGRSLVDDQDIFQKANNGTPGKGDGYFTSKQKTAQAKYGDRYQSYLQDYIDGINTAAQGQDTAGLQELLSEVATNETDKRLVWGRLDSETQAFVKSAI